jgi:hypothetical protein
MGNDSEVTAGVFITLVTSLLQSLTGDLSKGQYNLNVFTLLVVWLACASLPRSLSLHDLDPRHFYLQHFCNHPPTLIGRVHCVHVKNSQCCHQ